MKGRNRRGIPSAQSTADEDDDSVSSDVQAPPTFESKTVVRHENDKLSAAFQIRYIRLRFHGTSLRKGHTVILRLPANQIITRSNRL
ncbi:hypothetical protein BDU57DRAFT_521012 [Ampelomyces quisqualis]|uniref:Uncharacterized protein n=1 Tax=Ampelomyces quisqualis TaxID=50730 RepID=A0A6A5QIN6_AMPQU|nr:hypothetical protein BDU57DRAFT_521012 [Ampelomyces quisqualis]